MAFRQGELRAEDREAGRLSVQGDGYAAAGELVTLVTSPDVHRILGMSAPEIARAVRIGERYREALRSIYASGQWRPPHADEATLPARRAVDDAVIQLLGPERSARVRRLSWRIRSGDALLDSEVAAVLRLTSDQRGEIVRIAEENERAAAAALSATNHARGRGARLSDPAVLHESARRVNDAGHARLLAVLTPEQRARFAQLQEGEQ